MATGKALKYEPLRRYLAEYPGDRVALTLVEIEAIIGGPLPASARLAGWWANLRSQQSTQQQGWWSAGWRVAGTMLRAASPSVTFVRRWVEPIGGGASARP